MKYQGPLYGKLGRKCFDTGKTSDDWDALEEAAARRLALLRDICGASDVQNALPYAINNRIDAELGQNRSIPQST